MAILEVNNIEKHFGSTSVLKDVSFSLEEGSALAIIGSSGSGKTTLILESLVPALKAQLCADKLPPHIKTVQADGIRQIKLIDSTPIGMNIRSTVATYANVHDELRKAFARTPDAKR